MAYEVFKNVKTCTLGSYPITGVQSIGIQRTWTVISASADDDTFQTVSETGVCSVSGDITLVDPAEAHSVSGLSGARTLSWIEEGCKGGADDTVTVANVEIVSVGENAAHATAASASLSFTAYSADGSTDPVSRA